MALRLFSFVLVVRDGGGGGGGGHSMGELVCLLLAHAFDFINSQDICVLLVKAIIKRFVQHQIIMQIEGIFLI